MAKNKQTGKYIELFPKEDKFNLTFVEFLFFEIKYFKEFDLDSTEKVMFVLSFILKIMFIGSLFSISLFYLLKLF